LRKNKYNKHTFLVNIILCVLFYFANHLGFAQVLPTSSAKAITGFRQSLSPENVFIENIGQYGQLMKGYEKMGEVKFGYEGLDMPVLFTPKGLIHLQRRLEGLSQREKEKLEKRGIREEEIVGKTTVTDRTITMEWVGANPGVEIIAE
jgi:hypothetical protein